MRIQDTWECPVALCRGTSQSFCPADAFSLGSLTLLLRKQGRRILSLARKPSDSLEHMFNSIFFRGLRPHRAVLGICASVKPHRFSWSLSAEAWSPTMTSCKQLATKVLIFFLLIKRSHMLFLEACISNQHNQPLIWLIWVPLVPTVPYRHTAPVLGTSSKLSVASAALFSFKTKLFREDFTAFSAERTYFNLKAPTQIIQLDTKSWRGKGTFTSLWMMLQTSTTCSPHQEGLSTVWFFYPSSSTLLSVYRKGYLPKNENSCYFYTASTSPRTI